ATSIQAYREMGYLPDAIVNYLVRLGWSHGDQEVFTRDELIERFTLENVGKAAAVFNPDKLLWLNARYIKETSSGRLADLVLPFLIREGLIREDDVLDKEWLSGAIDTLKERSKTLVELSSSLRYYISDYVDYEEKARKKFLTEETLPYLVDLKTALLALDGFSEKELESAFLSIIERNGIKLRDLAQPVRVALTGGTKSPGIFEVIEVVGKERTIKRLERAIETIRKGD
ncbi:MAG TPA: glutamate--tRNA ligase, partial [Nitrospirae bacterium]|nr:glutamate--tRNA ligase [Nitrospirota bacterium]